MDWLDQMIQQSANYDTHKHDHKAWAREYSFDPVTAQIVAPRTALGSIPPLTPTQLAWTQAFAKLGPAVYGKGSAKVLPADYLVAVPPEIRAINLNSALKHMNGKEWLVCGYDGEARAVLSGDYTRLPSTEILETVKVILENEIERFPGLRPIRPFVSADDLSLKISWKDIHTQGNGGNHGIGTYITNGETGTRKFQVLPFIQRTSCENSIILDSEHGLSFIHRGSLRAMIVQLKAAIGQVFGASARLLNKLIEAEAEHIPDLEAVMTGLARMYGWDEGFATAAMIGTEGDHSRAGIVHGVSYAAHRAEQDSLKQASAEKLAGAILVAPGSLFDRARTVSAEQQH